MKGLRIDGTGDPAFRAVREALAHNLAAGEGSGETVAVVVDGKTVVNLWGGYRDKACTQPWAQDTLVCFFGQAYVALAVHMLIDRGRIDPERLVMHYWPEFGQAGKAGITVRQLVPHQVGIPGALRARPGDAYRWERMIQALEVQEPLFPPGTGCYHTFSFGHLCGELVRRVTGRSLGQFLREEVSLPLGVDFQFGLSAADQRRCAQIYEGPVTARIDSVRNKQTLLGQCWTPLPIDQGEDFNSELFRATEIPALNGHGTALGLARLYGALARGGELEGRRILSQAKVAAATTEQWGGVDPLGLEFRWGMGFQLRSPMAMFNDNPRSFGSLGISGAVAFGDPDARVGFAFGLNRVGAITTYKEPYVGPLLKALADSL